MKRLVVFIAIISLMFSCMQEEEKTSFSGTATGVEEGYFILGGPGGAKDTVLLNEDNTFDFEITGLEKAGSYYVAFDRDFVSFQIAPLKNVEMVFDKADFKNSVSFAGDGADINNYLLGKSNNENIKPAGPEVYSLAWAEYKEWADNNRKVEKELLESTPKADANDVFWVTEEANILYNWAQLQEMYPMYHKYYAKVEDVDLPDGHDEYKKELDLNKEEYLESRGFTSYVQSRVRELAYEKAKDLEGTDMPLLTLEVADELVNNKKVLDNFRVSFLKGQMARVDLAKLEDAISFVKENVDNEELIAGLDKEYEERMSLSAGQPGLDFSGTDLEGNVVKFSDFKGKYVYVDTWATWCGPCRGEIPYLKELEHDYADRNIVFLSYSIDDDKQAWLDFVPENELGGVQIFGKGAWQSDLVKHYKIAGIPRFMFFDPEGKIISVNMTRPSNEKTRETFDSYTDL